MEFYVTMNHVEFGQWCLDRPRIPSAKQPLIMAIINVTPDSFSDGGQLLTPEHAFKKAMSAIQQGADVLDIGGESSRPGAKHVSIDEELSRVIPVITRIRQESNVCLSIDTCKAEVMREAVSAGASFINDINALQGENALKTAKYLDVPVCLMHMKGTPETMQDSPTYHQDVVDEINFFFQERINACIREGIPRERIILDPGFGFGKAHHHNLALIKNINKFFKHRCPILLGVSRKSTIGYLLNKPISERMIGSIAMTVFTAMQGVSIIRTHDVLETKQVFEVLQAIMTV